GVEALREAVSGSPIDVSIFGRQLKSGNSTLDELLLKADGLGISSVVEHDHEYLCEIVEKARREGKQVAIHAGEKDRLDIKGAIDIKPDHIVHMTNASDRDIRHVADSKIPVVVCVRSNFVTGVGMPPVRKMIEEGLTVGVGTDNFMLNSPNIFSECEFMAKVFLHDDRKVLKISTLNGAKVLKRDGEIGSISEGKVADIIVIDDRSRNMVGVRNPIAGVVRRARPDDIKAVIHKGNLVENSEEKHGS
ncbi:MAG: amidohydrolase family protein, partial [Halobacteriota archaeon]|nr:amidohydrolase family protein [Halobacteriota archaeon]